MPVVWSGRAIACMSPAARSGSGCERPPPRCPSAPSGSAPTLLAAGRPLVEAASSIPTTRCSRSTTPSSSTYLASAWDAWEVAGLPRTPVRSRVVPYLFPTPACSRARPKPRRPPTDRSRGAVRLRHDDPDRAGHLGGGAGRRRRGADRGRPRARRRAGRLRAAVARPATMRPAVPSAARCYLNNTAIAAARLRDSGAGRVAVIDIDAHHGNGTQEIFYDEPGVLTAAPSTSTPAPAGSRTSSVSLRDRQRRRRGRQPQPRRAAGHRRRGWLGAVADARRAGPRDGGARALVVALGVDAASGDPESPLEVTAERLPAPQAARWARSACRRSSSRRAATTSPRSAASWARRWPGSKMASAAGAASSNADPFLASERRAWLGRRKPE